MNRHLTKEFRTLPTRYQGLGLRDPNINIEVLSAKINLLHRHFGKDSNTGGSWLALYLKHFSWTVAYQGICCLWITRFMVSWPNTLGGLIFGCFSRGIVCLKLRQDCYYPPLRKHDMGLMNVLVDGGVFTRTQLVKINRVRHYKGVFALSEITRCDGITIRQEMLPPTRLNYHEGTHRYPIQYPASSDIELWKIALHTIFSSTNTLSRPLGKYVHNPPLPYLWQYSASTDVLFRFHSLSASTVDLFVPSGERSRRHASRYVFSSTAALPPTATHYASLVSSSPYEAVVHSITCVPLAPPFRSLQEVLDSYDDQVVWEQFSYDGDGTWILHDLLRGSLVIVHDGSYAMCFVFGMLVWFRS